MVRQACMYYLFDNILRENVKIYGVRTEPGDLQCAEFLVFSNGNFQWLSENQFEPYRDGYDLH